MPKFKGRGPVACYHCHRQKVRCSGGQPCQRCHSRQKECIYSTKEAIVPVPESYLQHIDSSLNELKNMIRMHGLEKIANVAAGGPPLDNALSQEGSTPRVNTLPASAAKPGPGTESLVEDSTAESFIRKLREVLEHKSQPINGLVPVSPAGWSSSQRSPGTNSDSSRRTHVEMRFDTLQSNLNYRLPPYAYAVQLVTTAEREFGDYHTFLRKRFWKRLHATYRDFQTHSKDRNWLCRLSLVLALAEAGTTSSESLTISLDGEKESNLAGNQDEWQQRACPTLSSGVEFFEQGLVLLKISHEEPTVDDVEALNLASHCSYILNRRRSAYAYAGQSIRLAHSLGLDRPAPQHLSNLEREHWKRVWWTAFCIDRSTSAELGLLPAHVGNIDGLGYPDSSTLTPEENAEFYNPNLLTAQIKMCEMKSYVVGIVGRLKSKDIERPFEVLGECLKRLDDYRSALPLTISFDAEQQESNAAETRIVSSISLRHNQCYILLLRPILIHQFAFLLQDSAVITFSEDICSVNQTCLQAARNNARILLGLADSGRLVKYGYWDSVHLFSCLTILCLANLMASKVPGAFQRSEDEIQSDMDAYQRGRSILTGMVKAGNVPSRHHLSMLEEVEAIGTMLSEPVSDKMESGDGPSSGDSGLGNVEIELGFDHWGELMMPPDINFGAFDMFLLE